MATTPPPPTSNPPEPQPKPPAPPTIKHKLKRLLILSALAVLALAVAYTVGRVQTASHVTEAKQVASKAHESQQQTSSKLASEEALVDQLEARRRLHLTLLALDQRNFGIAAQHMKVAGELLARSKPTAGGDLAKLQQQIAGFKLVATEDLAGQRQKILDMAHRFDDLVPPEKP